MAVPVKRLYLSRRDRKIAGVCGGLAEYFELDPALVRVAWVLFTLLSFGAGILLYVIMALIVPPRF